MYPCSFAPCVPSILFCLSFKYWPLILSCWYLVKDRARCPRIRLRFTKASFFVLRLSPKVYTTAWKHAPYSPRTENKTWNSVHPAHDTRDGTPSSKSFHDFSSCYADEVGTLPPVMSISSPLQVSNQHLNIRVYCLLNVHVHQKRPKHVVVLYKCIGCELGVTPPSRRVQSTRSQPPPT